MKLMMHGPTSTGAFDNSKNNNTTNNNKRRLNKNKLEPLNCEIISNMWRLPQINRSNSTSLLSTCVCWWVVFGFCLFSNNLTRTCHYMCVHLCACIACHSVAQHFFLFSLYRSVLVISRLSLKCLSVCLFVCLSDCCLFYFLIWLWNVATSQISSLWV